MVRSRVSSRGDQTKSMTIYHPPRSGGVQQVRHYLTEVSWKLPFDLQWVEIQPGQSIPLPGDNKNRRIEAFEVTHSPGRLCLGYKLVETRKRLRPEYQGLFKEEIIRIKKEQGADALTENYDQILFTYSGDCMPLDPELVRDSEVLMHDATFVDAGDREEEYHATVREAVQVAKDAGVGSLILYHFSTRYQKAQILKEIRDSVESSELDIPVYFCNPYTFPNTRMRQLEK